MTRIKSYTSVRPEDTVGYCVMCNKLVRRTKKAACENGHPDYAVQGAQVLAEGEPVPQLPKFNWGAFFMPPIWGPAYGVWAGMIVLPLWLFTDSVIRAAVYGLGPDAALSAKIVTYGLAVLIPVLTIALMAWVGSRGWGMAWKRVYKTGMSDVSFETFKKRQRIWAVCGALGFIALLMLAVLYWVYVLPGQMAAAA